MGFSNLYYLNDGEISLLAKKLAENFFDDNLYRIVFPSEANRKKALPYFFRHYIKAIKPNCHFVADSRDKNCVMIIYDTSMEAQPSYYLRLLWMNIKMLPMMVRLHSFTSFHHMLDCLDMFTSRWVKEFENGNHFHVDLLYTKKEQRHKGYATKMFQEVMEEAKTRCYDMTMETHEEHNLPLYKEVGFKLMVIISHDAYDLKQYCLLLKHEQELKQ